MITAIKIGEGCSETLADSLHPTDENAVASGGDRLIDHACKNRRPVDLGDRTSGIHQVDALKPVSYQMIIAPREPVGQIGSVVRKDVDAQRSIGSDGLGDPAA